jgi:hypothetical protein
MRENEGLYRFARFVKQLVIGIVVLAVAVVAFGYLVFVRRADAPAAWTQAERELKGSVLQYGERVERIARVYLRQPTNYFRAANGLLVATQRRLLFVGIEPKDQLSSPDAPAAIITDEFVDDTLLHLDPGRVYALTAHGVRVQRSGKSVVYAAKRGHNAELDSLVRYVNVGHARQRREAAREQHLREQVAEMLRQPLKYEVKRGDALSTIATKFGATQDQIRQWNHMTSDKVRIKDTLIVKPAG